MEPGVVIVYLIHISILEFPCGTWEQTYMQSNKPNGICVAQEDMKSLTQGQKFKRDLNRDIVKSQLIVKA